MTNHRSTTPAKRPTVQTVLEMVARVAHSMPPTQTGELGKRRGLAGAVRLTWEMVRPRLGNTPQAQELDRLIAQALGDRSLS